MAQVIDKTAQTDKRIYGGKMVGGKPDGIVLHHTGSTNEAGDEWWLSHLHQNPVSINQLVRRSGEIVQFVPNDTVAWHAGVSAWGGRNDCNSWCIGVEICNKGDSTEVYTDAQYEAVAQTIAYNCARYKIRDENVTSHARCALPHGRKNDPSGWGWYRMWARVDELRQNWPFAPLEEWHDDTTGTRVLST